jgi:hypothetical protein
MITLDDLILVGKNGLKSIKEPPEERAHVKAPLKKRPISTEESTERQSSVILKQKETFEALTPDDQEYEKGLFLDGEPSKFGLFFKKELGLEPDPASKEPRMLGDETIPESMQKEIKDLAISGKCSHCDAAMMEGEIYCTNPDCKHPTEKGKKHLVVEEYISWKEEVEKKDSRGKPIYNPITKEKETEEKSRRVPFYSMVTVCFDKNGKPKSATCQKVNSQSGRKTDTGGARNRPQYRDIWNEVKQEYDSKIKASKREQREAFIKEREQEYVTRAQKAHPNRNPYTFGKLPRISPPKGRVEISQKAKKDPKAIGRAKCREWPLFSNKLLPRDLDKIECLAVRAAIQYVLEQPLPPGTRVWPYEDVTDVQTETDPKRSHQSPLLVDDKTASRFDRIYKLSQMK